MYRIAFLILLFSLSLPAAARMYQWVDPDTGTTQLSGKPPAWYRSGQAGPRVFVFENGRVVDDTGIEVSEGQQERLRQKALFEAARNREQAKEQLLEAKRMKALVDKEQQGREELPAAVPEFQPPPPPVEATQEESGEHEQSEEEKAEAMRKLVQEWEEMRTENARQVIESRRADPSLSADPAPSPQTTGP